MPFKTKMILIKFFSKSENVFHFFWIHVKTNAKQYFLFMFLDLAYTSIY